MAKIPLVGLCGSALLSRVWKYLLFFIFILSYGIWKLYLSNHQFTHPIGVTWSWPNKSTYNTTTVHSEPNLYSVAYPHQYHFILDEPEHCWQQNPYLVIMIPVAPLDQVARNAIRKTWGGEKTVLGKRVSHFYLLGQAKDQGKALQDQLLRESQEHRDLLQGNFLDSYHNLTIKTMLMLEWLASRCPNASYGIKTDSDVFLNVHSLIEGVIPSTPTHLYMTGNVVRQAPVHRDPNSKWFMPKEVFAESQYPPYVLGLSYVFSMDLPSKLIEASRHVNAIWLEDVYMGLCMRYLGINLTNPPENLLFSTSILPPKPYWNHVIAVTLESPQQLLDVWRKYKNTIPTPN